MLLRGLFAIALSASLPTLQAQENKLTIYMKGKPTASETYTISKSDDKVDIDGSGNADLGIMKIDIQKFEVTTDAAYHPISAVAKATLGKATMATGTTFADGEATNEINTGQGPTTKKDAIHPDAIVVNYPLPLFPWSILALRVNMSTAGPQDFFAYVIGKAEVPVTVTFKGKERVEFADKTEELNHFGASFTPPNGQPTPVEVWVNDKRDIVKLTAPSMDVEAFQAGYGPKPRPEPPEKKESTPPQEPE